MRSGVRVDFREQEKDAHIFSKPRFKEVSVLYGYPAKQFTIFGQHIHVGCASGDDAMFLLHSLNRYVPHFIALAASSPFVQRKDTLFNSARLNSVFAFPLSGRAPFTLSWDDFAHGYFARMSSAPQRWLATCSASAPCFSNTRNQIPRRTTTSSTTTTASRPADSGWTAS
jgi:gamma-glutamyl:cysteine ligase YbdK (ATP-grasp superfamily)